MAETLDYFLPNILTQDTRKRLQLHEDILTYLHSPGASSSCDDMDKFIDGISAWISGSNYKVCYPFSYRALLFENFMSITEHHQLCIIIIITSISLPISAESRLLLPTGASYPYTPARAGFVHAG